MAWEFLGKGLLIGFAIAAPVGPIGVLCIRRTFAEGRPAGLATGLGAATADALYGAIAGFGLTAVSDLLIAHGELLRLAGGAFLCVIAMRTFLARPGGTPPRIDGRGLGGAYASTVFLTLANPATILSFLAVFAGAGLGQADAGAGAASALVAGVLLGSAAWWVLLSSAVARWRERYPALAPIASGSMGGAAVTGVALGAAQAALRRINAVSAAVLLGFGLAALLA